MAGPPPPSSPPPSHAAHLVMESILPFYRRYAFEATLKGTSLASACLVGSFKLCSSPGKTRGLDRHQH